MKDFLYHCERLSRDVIASPTPSEAEGKGEVIPSLSRFFTGLLRSFYSLAMTIACLIFVSACSSTVKDPDQDGDLVADRLDNCPYVANLDQNDADLDKVGDICDPAGFWDFSGVYEGSLDFGGDEFPPVAFKLEHDQDGLSGWDYDLQGGQAYGFGSADSQSFFLLTLVEPNGPGNGTVYHQYSGIGRHDDLDAEVEVIEGQIEVYSVMPGNQRTESKIAKFVVRKVSQERAVELGL